MEGIIGIVVGALVCLGIIALLLKILSKHPIAMLVCRAIAAIGLIVSSFVMPAPETANTINWDWALSQFEFLFLYFVISWADIAFEIEERDVEYTTETLRADGSYKKRTEVKTERSSSFWSCLGLSLVGAAVLVGFNYGVFKNAVFLGIVGCIAFVWMIISIIRYIVKRRKRKSYYR